MKIALLILTAFSTIVVSFTTLFSAANPTPDYEYTRKEAIQEICQVGIEYRRDVLVGRMSLEQGEHEIRIYSEDLSKRSPTPFEILASDGADCLGFWPSM